MKEYVQFRSPYTDSLGFVVVAVFLFYFIFSKLVLLLRGNSTVSITMLLYHDNYNLYYDLCVFFLSHQNPSTQSGRMLKMKLKNNFLVVLLTTVLFVKTSGTWLGCWHLKKNWLQEFSRHHPGTDSANTGPRSILGTPRLARSTYKMSVWYLNPVFTDTVEDMLKISNSMPTFGILLYRKDACKTEAKTSFASFHLNEGWPILLKIGTQSFYVALFNMPKFQVQRPSFSRVLDISPSGDPRGWFSVQFWPIFNLSFSNVQLISDKNKTIFVMPYS